MNIGIFIPARFKSSRFEGKPIAKIAGKPMIQWVYEGIADSRYASFKGILTDDKRIFETAKMFGADVFMVTGNFESGTDRIAYFVKDKEFDYIVNMQGDEPLIDSETIDKLIESAIESKAEMATLITKCEKHLLNNPNVVKVVIDINGNAIYFSRSKIPYNRNRFDNYFKHIGIYIYSRATLKKLSKLSKGVLENAEGLEQLRALENGIKIKTCFTKKILMGVDTKEELKIVENYIVRNAE